MAKWLNHITGNPSYLSCRRVDRLRLHREKPSESDLVFPVADHQFLFLRSFNSADYARVETKPRNRVQESGRAGIGCIYFQPLTHIEHLVHFTVIGTRRLSDQVEYKWRFKEIVFNDTHRRRKIFKAFGLPSPAAMDHSMDLIKILFEQLLYN